MEQMSRNNFQGIEKVHHPLLGTSFINPLNQLIQGIDKSIPN
jgi:hypothetical protein